jgi:TctA family transporter
LAFFGAFGYVLRKFDCEPAPMLLGFILGPMMEENLRRALMISKGDPTVFFTRPLSAILLVLSALLLFSVMATSVRRKREEAFTEEE